MAYQMPTLASLPTLLASQDTTSFTCVGWTTSTKTNCRKRINHDHRTEIRSLLNGLEAPLSSESRENMIKTLASLCLCPKIHRVDNQINAVSVNWLDQLRRKMDEDDVFLSCVVIDGDGDVIMGDSEDFGDSKVHGVQMGGFEGKDVATNRSCWLM